MNNIENHPAYSPLFVQYLEQRGKSEQEIKDALDRVHNDRNPRTRKYNQKPNLQSL